MADDAAHAAAIDGQDGSVAAHPRRCSGLDENTAANIGDKTGPRRRARDNSAQRPGVHHAAPGSRRLYQYSLSTCPSWQFLAGFSSRAELC